MGEGFPFQILLVVLVGGVGAAFAYFQWQREKARRDALAQFARSMGWSFDPNKDSLHDDRYAHFEVFRKGHSRVAFNTMIGHLTVLGGRTTVVAGDFRYKITRGSGKSQSTRTYRFSYAIVHLPMEGVPDLLIRREGVFDKLATAFGADDIDFESEAFSRRFHVQSPDKKFAYDVLDQRMIEWLMSHEPPTVDMEHDRCLLTDGRTRWDPEEFRSAFAWFEAFFENWPDHVVRRYFGDQAWMAHRSAASRDDQTPATPHRTETTQTQPNRGLDAVPFLGDNPFGANSTGRN